MYVVEAITRESHPYPEVETVYHFVGEADEVRKFKQNIGSLVLGAMSLGDLGHEHGQHLIRRLQASDDILAGDKSSFEMVVEDSDIYKAERLRTLTTAAAAGELTIKALWGEFAELHEFEPRGSENINWLNKDGLLVHVTDTNLEVFTQDELENVHGADSTELKTAKELGLDWEAFQHEMVRDRQGIPRVLSSREHATLGRIDRGGVFVPVVSVLNIRDVEPRRPQNPDIGHIPSQTSQQA